MGNYFKIIRYSPGLEEYALILAYEDIVRRFDNRDALIFDTAPTALSLKFFNLTRLSLSGTNTCWPCGARSSKNGSSSPGCGWANGNAGTPPSSTAWTNPSATTTA